MSEIKGFAFDIEGTLYKNGKLRKGVTTLFQAIEKTGKPVMFVSGMNQSEIKQIIQKINTEANTNINPTIASNCGAVILKDKKTTRETLTKSEIFKIQEILEKEAPGSIIVYRTTLNNMREKVSEAEGTLTQIKKGITVGITELLNRLKIVEIEAIPTASTSIYKLIEENAICSLDIIALPNQTKKIAKCIQKQFPTLAINPGASIQVSKRGKWQALTKVFGDKAKNVCYFGDSTNDIECIKNCEKAIASNSKKKSVLAIVAQEQSVGRQKFATNNLGMPEVLDFVAGREFSKDELANISSVHSPNSKTEKQKVA